MKRPLLATLVTAGTLLSGITMAHAATTQYQPTHIILNGTVVTSPQHTTAIDPSTHQKTSFVPIYYAMEVLKKLGITSTWDGTTWSLSVPSSLNPDLSNPTTETNQMYFVMNGVRVEAAPKLVTVDPSSNKDTTYVPIYYLEHALQRIGVSSTWNGTTWNLANSTGPATVIAPTVSTTTTPTQQYLNAQAAAVLSSITWTDNGQYRTFSAPLFALRSGWELDIGFANPTTHATLLNATQVSLDNGKTWQTVRAGYDSFDSTQGGLLNLPTGVTRVLVRGPVTALEGIGFGWIGNTSSVAIADMVMQPDGTRTIKYYNQLVGGGN